MMDQKRKSHVVTRLRRIEGQVRGIERMVVEDRYCMDVLTQTRSIVAALRAVEDLMMESHLNTCVSDAIRLGNDSERSEKVDELMAVLSQYRKHG